jgi:PAS domain S-box-containing protein
MILPSRRNRLDRLGGFLLAAVLVSLQLLLILAAIRSDRLGEHALILLLLPLAFASVAFGMRGAVVAGVLTSLLTVVWWLEASTPGGLVWLVARTLTYLVIALTLGWFVDSRARLLRKLEHHNHLSLDLIATASFDGYFTELNPALTKVLGFSREELLERPLLEFVHPEDREGTLAAIADQTQQGRPVLHFRNRYRTKGGSYRWLEWMSCPDAQAKELIAVARDVTERKRLEELEAAHTERLEPAVRERTQELEAKNADLEEARLETLRRLVLAAEYRDDDTHHHTERVGPRQLLRNLACLRRQSRSFDVRRRSTTSASSPFPTASCSSPAA